MTGRALLKETTKFSGEMASDRLFILELAGGRTVRGSVESVHREPGVSAEYKRRLNQRAT